MQSKIAFLLVVICVAESIFATPIDDAIKELRPKVEAAKKKINDAVQQNVHKLEEAHKIIDKDTRPAEQGIHKQLEQLRKSVHEAEVDAQKNGKNIKACVTEENKSRVELKLRKNGVGSCRRNKNLRDAGHKLGELRRLKHTVAQSIRICQNKNPSDAAALKKCVETQLNVDGKIKTVANEIEKDLKVAEKEIADCAKTTSQKLKPAIEKIQNDFNACVKEA